MGTKGGFIPMRFRVAAAALLLLTACGSVSKNSIQSNAARTYSGTASVGDFLSIKLDPAAQTLTYSNYSNGDSGIVPYTTNADGTYTLNDSSGNMVSGYEVPNYGLLIEAHKAGADHNTLALITSVETSPITLASLSGKQYNYMQFRTAAGGLEAGSVTMDAQGNVSVSGYWPYGALGMGQNPNAFNSSSFPAAQFVEGPSGNFLTMTDTQGGVTSTDYVFGTANGVFVVDTSNGSILAFKKAASKDFDPSVAGSYKSVYYQKTGAATGQGNVETGTPSLGHATITVDASGNVTVTDTQSNVMLSAALTPVADASYLYDGSANELADPCFGLFTFRVMHGNQPQDVFVTFVNGAMLFGSFSPVSQGGSGYEYLYGVGLK